MDDNLDDVANFRLPWSPLPEHAGTLVVEALQASTPDAYRSMWMLLTDFDLTRKIAVPCWPVPAVSALTDSAR
ncbi:hypothetical protein [Micromonospora avicenniae]|uniref:hypothetical protein n=1 Tax=Micromonospora avicenniae TaxID=1198245 RepID=UPI0033235582